MRLLRHLISRDVETGPAEQFLYIGERIPSQHRGGRFHLRTADRS
ncbi:hypothetical protein AB0L00_44925 [Actinoallomurus sp. NPDC052308]